MTVTTAADYEQELVDALNLLIEDERASVEMEVALASGATEYAERETLARMGADDIHSCETLRAEMERAELPVTPQINGVVFEVLGAERYDDRLRAFAHHQRIVADRASDLLESNLDGELRDALLSIVDAHQRHIEWANIRADAFATTRLMEFGPRQHSQPADALPPTTTDADVVTPPVSVSLPDIPSEDVIETPVATPVETPVEELFAEEAPAATPVEAAPIASVEPDASVEATPAEAEAPRPRRSRTRKPTLPAE
jgi:hypothetical protein